MPLPPKLFYPICEIATRWSVSPIDIVGWAIDRRITLSAVLPLVEAKQGRPAEGLVEVSGQDIFDLFDAGAKKKSTVRVQRFRRRPGARWEKIVTPADGVPSSHQASSSRAPKPNASSASMDFLAITPLTTTSIQRKPPRFRSASPAHQPATTGTPSPAPSHGVFTTKACRRARANWSATCSTGSPRQVEYRMKAQFAGACRRCGRC